MANLIIKFAEELKLRLAESSSWMIFLVAISIISFSTAVFGIVFSVQNTLQSLAESHVTAIVNATGDLSVTRHYTNFNDYASSDLDLFRILMVSMAIVLLLTLIITAWNSYTKSIKFEVLRGHNRNLVGTDRRSAGWSYPVLPISKANPAA
ncbi:hypothetical protein [Levilactobacillus yonginensis]